MKKSIFIVTCIILLTASYFPTVAQDRSKDAYEILVINRSGFDITCTSNTEKNEGIFSANTTLLKAGALFLFRVMKTPGGILPRGVEGTIEFHLVDTKYNGNGQVYFDNPAVGSPSFQILASNWPLAIEEISQTESAKYYIGYFLQPASCIILKADTTQHQSNPNPLNVGGSNKPSQNMDEPIPSVINFDWQVIQRMPKDENDENDGKAYKQVTYFFTSNGDYAAVKPEDKSFSLMVYSKKGHTWIFDDNKKTILVMNMPKTVGEGGMMGKQIAEDINKGPLKKHVGDDEKYTVTKTGKTKTIFGKWPAEEYQIQIKNTNSTNKQSGAASFWYAKVPFDPVKIYTMGVGRPADISKLQNDPKMKNNIAAIPVLNKNFLWVETEAGGKKGMETIEIKNVNNTIYTAGYKIKVMNSLKDIINGDDH